MAINVKQIQLSGVNSSSIEASGDTLIVKSQGIVDSMVKNDAAIAITKLAAKTISGKDLGTNLSSLAAAANSGIAMTSYNGSAAVSDLAVVLDGNGGLEFNGASGIRLEAAVAGNGLDHNSGVLSIDRDGDNASGLDVGSDGIKIRQSGVVNAMVAAGTLANDRLVNDSVQIGTTSVDLGATASSLAGLQGLDFAAGNRTLFGSQADGDILTIGAHPNGKVVVKGDLQVDGDTLTVNSTIVQIDDKMMELAVGMGDDAAVDGGGITVKSSDGDKTLSFAATGDNWASSEHFSIASNKLYKINNVEVLSASGAKKVQADVKGDGLAHNAGVLSILLDGNAQSGLAVGGNGVKIAPQGIVNSMVKDDAAIAITKLAEKTISGKDLGTNLDTLSPAANGGLAFVGGANYNGGAARTVKQDWKFEVVHLSGINNQNCASNSTNTDSQSHVLVLDGSHNDAPAGLKGKTLVANTHPMYPSARILRNGVQMQLANKSQAGTLDGSFQFKIVQNGNDLDVYIVHDNQSDTKASEFTGDNLELIIPVTN